MATRTNTKAEMGVGTLIIFISLLLVAAVAAGVLIQSAGSLQQRALSTGNQATGQIATNAVVQEVSATDGTDRTVENFSATYKLAPGSGPIKFDDVTFSMSTTDYSTTYTYTTGSPSVNASTNTGEFALEYLQTGENSQVGTLTRGDVVRLWFLSPTNISESSYVRLNFIPQIGTATQTIFDTPDVMSTQRVYLYP